MMNASVLEGETLGDTLSLETYHVPWARTFQHGVQQGQKSVTQGGHPRASRQQ